MTIMTFRCHYAMQLFIQLVHNFFLTQLHQNLPQVTHPDTCIGTSQCIVFIYGEHCTLCIQARATFHNDCDTLYLQ